jgi:site-specific recombinase XerD
MPPPKLLDQVRAVIRVKRFSLSTERAYVGWIRRFILFHNKQHPKEMAEAEIRQFISHLAVNAKISASTQTVALSALLFEYRGAGGRAVGRGNAQGGFAVFVFS